jgi:hypothetical protein
MRRAALFSLWFCAGFFLMGHYWWLLALSVATYLLWYFEPRTHAWIRRRFHNQ